MTVFDNGKVLQCHHKEGGISMKGPGIKDYLKALEDKKYKQERQGWKK